jgi:hypothetical protein
VQCHADYKSAEKGCVSGESVGMRDPVARDLNVKSACRLLLQGVLRPNGPQRPRRHCAVSVPLRRPSQQSEQEGNNNGTKGVMKKSSGTTGFQWNAIMEDGLDDKCR